MNKFQKFKLIVLILVAFFPSQLLKAQPVPVDPAIKIGKLPNGLTYYIRHNEEPKERASFYIIQNVGAILEEDNQNGLAHFLEHMAFNGTKNFPEKGIIKTLEKHGVAFGKNINAYTSFDETVYNLSDVPVKKPGLLDTCLLILNDWSDFLLLTDKEIDMERGVILEEWRTGQNSNRRMSKQTLPVIFKDSKYAVRDIIGDTAIIKNFKYETLRKFYKDWYRTDLQAIAVVGDIDVAEVEKKIIDLFGKIPAEVNPPERIKYEIPLHKETLFKVATDPEATSSSVSVYIKLKGIAPKDKDLKYYRNVFVENMFNRMMSDRIAELIQKGDPPFINGSVRYGGLTRGYNLFSISTTAHPNQCDKALRAVYTEAERVLRYGFTQAELDRAKSNILTQTESMWKQRDKISNEQYVYSILNNYLTNDPLESIDKEWELTQKYLAEITLDEVSQKAKLWMVPESRVIIVSGPQAPDIKLLTEAEALAIIKEVEGSEIKPYTEKQVASSLISEELTGSKIVKTKALPEFNAVEWTLGNNAKIVFRKADFQKDQVSLNAVSYGGSSLYSPEYLASAMLLPQMIGSFGIGDFDAIALKKMLTGKKVSTTTLLSSLNESVTGSSTPKDFETMLQMLYLNFEKPRFDKEAYEALKKRIEASLANMNKNPQKIMSDSLSLLMSNYSNRTILFTPEIFTKVSLQQMEEIYRNRFADAGDFIFFIVGNVDEETVKPLVEKYIGSIKDNPRKESWKDNHVNMPKGKTSREIQIPLQTAKSTVIIAYNTPFKYKPKNNLMLSVLRDILKLRYTEEIREKEGGTYGVGVSSGSSRIPQNEKSLQISFDTNPEKADYLKSIVYKEIDKIIASGPTQEDLDKTVKNILKEREQLKPNNSYWMGVLVGYYQNKVNSDLPKNYEDILKKLTTNDIKKFAKSFFAKPDVLDVVFKPL